MRKLASIQRISEAEPIPNADAIQRLRVLGWSVVGKKSEFTVGDKVVYCEIDSLLPERPEFEFLRAGCYRPAIESAGQMIQRAGFRIKTIRMRGQVSQGICFPLSILPADAPMEIGTDVTELLDIIKYEPPVPAGMGGRVKGQFPAFLPKTDETRIQVLEGLLRRHAGTRFAMTEKLDGTSFTAFLRDGEFGVCSRNQWLDETDLTNSLCRIASELKLQEKLAVLGKVYGFSPAIQGELIGPGIQGNKYALIRPDLRIFNVLNIDDYRLVDRSIQSQMIHELGLTAVPDLGELTLNHSVDELVAMSVGTSILNSKAQREGIVFRPEVEIHEPEIGARLSFKVINPQFLLKYDE